jgi:hypothetical protein
MPLSRFETLAQRLVEGSFNRLFGGQLEPLEVATRLARALEDTQLDGQAADYFDIHLHPSDYDSIRQRSPRLSDELAIYIARLAQQAGLSLTARPQIDLTADPVVTRRHIRVRAEHRHPDDPTTQVYHREAVEEALAALRKVDAYLIVEGRRHVPLSQPVITLGRRTDNDIVLDSPTVSRQHAQIRWRYGRFVLYDVSNRNRTLVNGEPVIEHALQPGDVMAISDVLLIYGEGRDQPPPTARGSDGEGQTLSLPKDT